MREDGKEFGDKPFRGRIIIEGEKKKEIPAPTSIDAERKIIEEQLSAGDLPLEKRKALEARLHHLTSQREEDDTSKKKPEGFRPIVS